MSITPRWIHAALYGGAGSDSAELRPLTCLVSATPLELPELYSVFIGSDGGLYAGGIQNVSNNRHGVIVR